MATGILSLDRMLEAERMRQRNQQFGPQPGAPGGGMPPPPPPTPQPSFLQRLGTKLKDPTTLTALAAGFDRMTLNPNPQLQQRASDMLAVRSLKDQSNQTIQMLMESGDPQAMEVAKLIQADPINAKAYLQAYVSAKFREPKATFDQKTGAQLNELMGTSAYDPKKIFNVNSETGKISEIGGGGVAIDLSKKDLPAGLKKLDEAYAEDHLEWTRGGGADMGAQVAQVNTVLQKLEAGEQLTGPTVGLINNVGMLGLINPDAQDAKEQIEEVVQRNLRLVLGAQFTEKEGAQLIKRAYNPMLKTEKNIARLRKLYAQMEIARQQRQAMADYFDENYTLRGYTGPQPNIDDFYTALSGLTVGQELGGYTYLGGDRNVKSNWKKIGP